jgi:hypothetical protein
MDKAQNKPLNKHDFKKIPRTLLEIELKRRKEIEIGNNDPVQNISMGNAGVVSITNDLAVAASATKNNGTSYFLQYSPDGHAIVTPGTPVLGVGEGLDRPGVVRSYMGKQSSPSNSGSRGITSLTANYSEKHNKLESGSRHHSVDHHHHHPHHHQDKHHEHKNESGSIHKSTDNGSNDANKSHTPHTIDSSKQNKSNHHHRSSSTIKK